MALSVPIVLIIAGVILAVTLSGLLGGLLIVVGLILLFVPYARGGGTRTARGGGRL